MWYWTTTVKWYKYMQNSHRGSVRPEMATYSPYVRRYREQTLTSNMQISKTIPVLYTRWAFLAYLALRHSKYWIILFCVNCGITPLLNYYMLNVTNSPVFRFSYCKFTYDVESQRKLFYAGFLTTCTVHSNQQNTYQTCDTSCYCIVILIHGSPGPQCIYTELQYRPILIAPCDVIPCDVTGVVRPYWSTTVLSISGSPADDSIACCSAVRRSGGTGVLWRQDLSLLYCWDV